MITTLIPVLVGAAFAPFLLNLVLTKFILFISHYNNWYDSLDQRKIHAGEVPRLGGVGFFLSFVLSSLLFVHFAPGLTLSNEIWFMIAGFFLVHVLGLVDDFRNIPARWKLLGQIIAGTLVVFGGAVLPGVSILGMAIPFYFFSIPLTVFWLISLSNAVNLIDGVDGLAGGVSLIAAVFFAVVHLITGNPVGAIFALSLAGSLLAFLMYNKPKAKLFMGDSGSLFLGFVLGSMFFIGVDSQSSLAMSGIGVSLTLLVIPVADMLAAILRRIRKRLPIFAPDREHMHHKLLDFGFSVPKILLLIYGMTGLSGIAVLLWALSYTGVLSLPLWIAEGFLFLMWIFILLFFIGLHKKNQQRTRE